MQSDDASPLVTVLSGRKHDIGEMTVRRVLPRRRCPMVGPFIFFDHMGPAAFKPGAGIAVRPHPHIGLATVTYLFEGEILHRDSLGIVQPIQAGAVNLMTAGRGIVHSERAGDDVDVLSRLHGIQSWMALPVEYEDMDPAFVHYPSESIPETVINGAKVRTIIGTAFGATSPVEVVTPMLYVDCSMNEESDIELPVGYTERAFYVVSGHVVLNETTFEEGMMGVVATGRYAVIHATVDSRIMILGGETVGERHIWWNFVSSSRARIDQAASDWQAGRFDGVPGDDEYIPLPESPRS